MIMGWVFGRINNNTSDYFRGGQRGTWWLVGTSMLMAAVSARTFTANSGVAYDAGFTFILIYIFALIAMPIEYYYLAPRFRRLRLTTTPEVIRERFDPLTEQFAAYLRMITSLFLASAWLWGLAIFVGSVFGYPVSTLIVVLGIVVIVYATVGGSWAVMATDFVQGLILVSMCCLLCALSLMKTGGVDGMISLIKEQGLWQEFAIVKPQGAYTERFGDAYTWPWALTIIASGVMWNLSMGTAEKYFAVKDEKHAKRLALMVGVSTTLLVLVFMVPNITSRLFFSSEVAALAGAGLSKAAEGSFAVASLQLLPAVLVPMMVVAMFSATLSSLDTGMNRNAALFMLNIVPPLCKRFSIERPTSARELFLSKVVTVVFGVIIIAGALQMSGSTKGGMFEMLLNINALLTPPLVIPMIFGLFIKRNAKCAAWVAIVAGFMPGLYSLYLQSVGEPWNFVEKTWWVSGITAAAYLLCIPFHNMNSQAYRDHVDRFFTKMATPVDFDKEVGHANDGFQMTALGAFSIISGLFVLALTLLPSNSSFDRLCILAVSGMILAVGVPLFVFGLKSLKRSRLAQNEGA